MATLPLPPPIELPPHPVTFDEIDPDVARDHPERAGKPDGVPHDIVGMLAFGIVIAAMVMLGAYLLGGVWPALAIAAVAAVFLIARLSRRSTRERDEEAHDPRTGPGPA